MPPWCQYRWQEINEAGHSCHWWLDIDQRKISAMLLLLILTVTLVIAALGGWLPDTRDPRYGLRLGHPRSGPPAGPPEPR